MFFLLLLSHKTISLLLSSAFLTMEVENERMQEKSSRKNELNRKRYHANKNEINKRRHEETQILLAADSTSTNSHPIDMIQLQGIARNMQNIDEPTPNIEMHHSPSFPQEFIFARNNFRSKLDSLSRMSTCMVCMERYPGIKTRQTNGMTTCYRCTSEKKDHCFSNWNNMDLGEQPICLKVLSQVEEMLIARVSPILQVTYARGGQLKYSGNTICFPQDISSIASYLPRHIIDLDILIVNREQIGQQQYNFHVSRGRVHEALKYKICNDPYYKDVQIDEIALSTLLESSNDISSLIYATSLSPTTTNTSIEETSDNEYDRTDNLLPTTSYVSNLPHSRIEVEEVRSLLQLGVGRPTPTIAWPTISPSPINEYNTEGLFAMAFPTLFPKGKAAFKQQRMKEIKIHEYALHLLRYHDKRFGQHPQFRYFILNIIMRHHSQATSSVFVHKNLHGFLPSTVSDLRQRLQDMPDDKLADQLMRFSSSICGTRPFWTQRRGELSDMVIQIGCPSLFFTLSVADTKWPDLHTIMPTKSPTNPSMASRWRIQNILQNPHLTAIYMHHRFTAFREEVLEKLLGASEYWYR